MVYNRNMAKIKFTKEQIDKFQAKMGDYASEEDFLTSYGAVKYVEGERCIMEYTGIAGKPDPITGATFTNDFPYSLYQLLIEEVQKRTKKKQYAIKKEVEHLEQTALSISRI